MQRGLILLAAGAAAAAAAAAIATAAPAATRGFSVTSFDRIRLEGPFAVTLRTGAGASARAEGPDQRMLERVRIELMGRTLVIRRDQDAAAGGTMKGVRIALSTPAITGATVLGAGSLTVDTARAPRFDAAVSGAGGLVLTRVDADVLNLTITGAGTVAVGGSVQQVRAIVQGAGTITAPDLKARDVTITTAGTGTVTMAASRTAKVNATGGGTITILGTPACTVASEGTVEVICAGPAVR